MELVNVDLDYLRYNNAVTNKSNKQIGLVFYISEYKEHIFIPLTSFKEKYNKYNKYDSRVHILIDKHRKEKAVLKISDYLVVGKYYSLINIERNSIEQVEFEIIKKDKSTILRKLNDTLKSNNKRRKSEISQLKKYEYEQKETTRKFSEQYIKEILYSVTLFENLDVTPHNIEAIVNLSNEKINISGHDNMILSDAMSAWKWVLDTLEQPIDIDYIINLNKLVAEHQALKVGQLRDGEGGYVHGSEYNPPIPEYGVVETKVKELLTGSNILDNALQYFCYATKNQLFYDGNKRTSYLIVNKILIANGIGIFYINDEVKEEFNKLLNNHYNYSHIEIQHKDILIEFINTNCIIYKTDV